jgi:outer membrane lipoprotein-sorting protein
MLKCTHTEESDVSYKKNSMLIFERHNPNPIIILTNIMVVTIDKHSDRDTETACFVRRT